MIALMQPLLILALAPLVQGILRMLRARLNGRHGPPPWQTYRDLRKLLQKHPSAGTHVSPWLYGMPGLTLGVAITAALLIPAILGRTTALLPIDAVMLAFLFALGRAGLLVGALDTGSSFAAMGAGRELTFAAITEAPLVLALLAGAIVGQSSLAYADTAHAFGALLAGGALFLVLLFESARVPVDNQETHYELTMIHEALVLEFSGRSLAIFQYASYIRQAILIALVAFVISGTGIPAWAIVIIIIAAIPFVEVMQAKLRLFEVPQLASAATLLAIAAIGFDLIGIAR